MLWPTWHDSAIQPLRKYAKNLNVEVWCFEGMKSLFLRLRELFDQEKNDSLCLAQKELDQAPQPLFGVQSPRAVAQAHLGESGVINGIELRRCTIEDQGFVVLYFESAVLGWIDRKRLSENSPDYLEEELQAIGYRVTRRPN